MWRLLGLTLVCVASAATAANADSRLERPTAGRIETALQQSAAVAGTRQRSLKTAAGVVQLQIGGALAFSQSSLRAAMADARASSPEYVVPVLALRGVRQESRHSGLSRWLDLNSSQPRLAYSVTDTLSLGLDYRYLRGEDLVFKVAKTGSLGSDYQSHNVLLQAHWDF